MIVKNPIITSPFGKRILQGKEQFHDGIDFISGDDAREVFSIGSGRVVMAFKNYVEADRWKLGGPSSGGNYVITRETIDGKDYYLKYLHLIENYVKENVDISASYLLGKFADVGYSFGPHVHVSVYDLNWRIVDPSFMIKHFME